MKKTIGILAHVDGGKTTFSEQLLYHTKSIRNRGRVDHKNSYLDNNEIEKDRGITIYSEVGKFSRKSRILSYRYSRAYRFFTRNGKSY